MDPWGQEKPRSDPKSVLEEGRYTNWPCTKREAEQQRDKARKALPRPQWPTQQKREKQARLSTGGQAGTALAVAWPAESLLSPSPLKIHLTQSSSRLNSCAREALLVLATARQVASIVELNSRPTKEEIVAQ